MHSRLAITDTSRLVMTVSEFVDQSVMFAHTSRATRHTEPLHSNKQTESSCFLPNQKTTIQWQLLSPLQVDDHSDKQRARVQKHCLNDHLQLKLHNMNSPDLPSPFSRDLRAWHFWRSDRTPTPSIEMTVASGLHLSHTARCERHTHILLWWKVRTGREPLPLQPA